MNRSSLPQSQEELVDIMQDIQSCIKKAQEKKRKRSQGEPTHTWTLKYCIRNPSCLTAWLIFFTYSLENHLSVDDS